jgi:uncharacterized membrane protein (DUF4010 family)
MDEGRHSGQLIGFAVALGVGLLVGIERERHHGAQPGAAGVRTFTLIALAGAICTLFGPLLVAVGAGFVGISALAAFRATHERDPGLTSEVAMFVVFLLGALAMSQVQLAAGLGAGVALLLVLRERLHAFAREVLTARELHDALLLAGAALIVLPLLPDRAVDPWQVLNPRKLWQLVVLVMAINGAGYVAQRALGTRLGLPLSGFAGGFVSATATIGAMAQRARADAAQLRATLAASTVANVATVVQLGVVIGALSTPLLQRLWPALLASGITALLFAAFFGIRIWRERCEEPAPLGGRPFEPRHALLFAALIAAILLASAALQNWFGRYGALAAAASAGFADAHAAAASMAQMGAAGRLDIDSAAIGVLAGFATNTLSKLLVAWWGGGQGFALRLLPGLVAMLAAFVLALQFS